jgi:hypothetical protein
MNRQAKTKRWILAAAACAVLAANASTAAEHAGKSVPKSGESVSHQESLPAGQPPDPGTAADKTGAAAAGRNSGPAGNRDDAGNLAARPSGGSTANGRFAKGGTSETGIEFGSKSAARSIDLIRPDDGYANLHRRATRSSLVAAGKKNKLQVVPPVAVTPHQLSLARAPTAPPRNSAGIALPVSTGVGKPDSIQTMPGGPVNTSLAKNSVGMSLGETYRPEIHRPETHLAATGMAAPVTGINGTTMGHAGAGGVGGPAKDRSAINGSALRPRF